MMRHRETPGSNGFLGAFVLGSLVGGVTALLFAPSSGRRLRRSLARGGRRFRRRAWDSVESAQERAQAAVDQASESLHEIAEDARRMTRNLRVHR
jgi:gas vesicle protein